MALEEFEPERAGYLTVNRRLREMSSRATKWGRICVTLHVKSSNLTAIFGWAFRSIQCLVVYTKVSHIVKPSYIC